MRDFYLLAFILALPAIAVLGHDIYMAYNNTNLDVADRFYFSDLGWLWINYSPDTYDWVIENVDSVIWNDIIDPVLQRIAFYILSIPFAILLATMVFMKMFGLGSFEGNGFKLPHFSSVKKKPGFSHNKGEAKKRTKYKRK